MKLRSGAEVIVRGQCRSTPSWKGFSSRRWLYALALCVVTPVSAARAQVAAATPGAHEPPPVATLDTAADADIAWTHWTSGRYRINPGDVLDLRFPFVPELNQSLAVQPDGYITLGEIGDRRVQGLTVAQVREQVREAYVAIVRDPVFTVVLTEFEKPYFVAAGEVTRPGRYDLRGATTLTQAIAYSGGPTSLARISEVVIFRPHSADTVLVQQVDIKAMYAKRDLSEDPLLRPGDTIFVPKSTLGKLAPILSRFSFGIYINPMDFWK
jgi:polysaccharide export outer membrane protein